MSEWTERLRTKPYISCDSCGCVESGRVVDNGNTYREMDLFIEDRCAHGWTVWVGRTRRHYCPNCYPKPGHKMRLTEGTER